eukprot:scaffold3402_cov169-Amphora_coffeaeformis.AAC.10
MAKSSTVLIDLPAEVKSAMETMRWNLTDLPPMMYKSVDEMKAMRPTIIDIDKTIQSLAEYATLASKETKYVAQIATSLLLLGNGYTDEAHDLVLGLSWRGDLPYAYGASVNLEDETVQTLACYAHCLVHRMEGPHDSEFSMNGFQNSEYWAGNAMRNLDGMEALPLAKIRQGITELVDSEDAHDFVNKKCTGIYAEWDPRIMTELCRDVVVHEQEKKSKHPMHEFAENAALLELKVVLQSALVMMGFDVSSRKES